MKRGPARQVRQSNSAAASRPFTSSCREPHLVAIIFEACRILVRKEARSAARLFSALIVIVHADSHVMVMMVMSNTHHVMVVMMVPYPDPDPMMVMVVMADLHRHLCQSCRSIHLVTR
jgi:hypothetical protein